LSDVSAVPNFGIPKEKPDQQQISLGSVLFNDENSL